jgi:hypothetical protein
MIKELKESISLGGELDVWEALKSVNEKIGMYSEILKKGSADKVPSEVRASIGQEYEVTKSVGEGYYAETGLEYTDVMQIITSQAAIGRGPDGIFEIITQPTDNPYLLILEMKLLQDLDFIDFNFSQYPQAARGYHLTLGGVEGLRPGAHTYFLQNALTCANLVGINAGEETFSDRRVHDKGGDVGHDSLFSEEATSMVEFKNFSCDKWEMFERAVLTSHNAAIAIQAVEKFTDLDSLEKLRGLSGENFGSAREFYDNLKKKGLLKKEVKDDRIKEIVFSWINLQVKFLKMAKDHNENFLNNEMYGYLDEGGDWTDAQDFSSRDNRGEFISYLERINLYRKQAGLEPYSSLEDYFDERQRISDEMLFGDKSSDLSNRLAAVNNFSLKSGVFSGEGSRESGKRKSEVEVDRANVGSVFNTRIGHQKEYLEGFDDKPEETSIFERKGESRGGYYYFQGFSERMISHQSQVLLLKFNEEMEGILSRETSEEGVTKKSA